VGRLASKSVVGGRTPDSELVPGLQVSVEADI
jgi:hypothetical protein